VLHQELRYWWLGRSWASVEAEAAAGVLPELARGLGALVPLLLPRGRGSEDWHSRAGLSEPGLKLPAGSLACVESAALLQVCPGVLFSFACQPCWRAEPSTWVQGEKVRSQVVSS
jgi:hypothetical protein